MESRVSHEPSCEFDIMIQLVVSRVNLVILLKTLRLSPSIASVNVVSTHGSIKGSLSAITKRVTAQA